MRTDILDRKEDILRWIEEERPKSYIAKELGCKPETLNNYLNKMGIIYAGQPGKGVNPLNNGYQTAEEYIISGSVISSSVLKKKLIRDGIKEKKCEICGLSFWQGVELPLELHHKDGNHYNNELSNLEILCPNCHSIQEGNNGAGRRSVENFCVDCGISISDGAVRCKSCSQKVIQSNKKKPRPSREELKTLIRSTSFLQIGRQYDVSDNAIRKWCDDYHLPRTVSKIKALSDKEWEKI